MAEILQFPTLDPVLEVPARPDEPPQDASVPPDAAARARALDRRQSFIVEAPAGSGKTALLVQRFLGLLLDPELDAPEEILAITFTRKATAELRERVHAQLEKAASEGPAADDTPAFERTTRCLALDVLTRDRERGWRLREHPQRLNIRSIDSVCSALAGAMPVLSGMGGQRRTLEDAAPLYQLAALRTLMQLGQDTPLHAALRTVLLHRDANLADTERLLAGMLEAREQWGELIPLSGAEMTDEVLDGEVRGRLQATLEAIVCAGLSRAQRLMPAGALDELARLAHVWSDLPGYSGKPSPIGCCRELPAAPEARADCLDHWRALIELLLTGNGLWRTGFNKNHIFIELGAGEKSLLKDFIASIEAEPLREALAAVRDLPPASYPEDQWVVAKALFRILRHAMAELKVLFAERAVCDFAELSLDARAALAQEPALADLALAGGGRLRHLLVDEMQDTSAAQYDLLEQITRSWDGRTQTVFLVGDPKQSIYAFRQASVTRFLRTMNECRLGELPLERLRLTANFRSQGELVRAFNRTFALLFPPDSDPSLRDSEHADVPFVAAEPVHRATEAAPLHWHVSLLQDRKERPAAIRDQARNIRQIIQLWRDRPLEADRADKPWRIAVLARARNHLAPVAAELREAGIPFHGVDIESLSERQEVLDVLALTRALLHLGDRTAWLAVLRAPWCGLTLADLLLLTGEGPEADLHATVFELMASRSHLLSADAQQLLARSWPVLEHAVATLGQTALSTHVERTWRSLGGDAPLSAACRRNVEQYFRLLAKLEAENDGRVELEALLVRLGKLFAEGSGSAADVQLMTVHKAKGLEWDVVLVPGLERRPQADRSRLLNWLELDATPAGDASGSILLAPVEQRGDKAGPLNQWLRHTRRMRDQSERKRLLYVGCTRAIRELHLFAAPVARKDGRAAKEPGSLLEVALPAAEGWLQEHSAEAGELFTPPEVAAEDPFTPAELADGPLELAAAEEPDTTAADNTAAPLLPAEDLLLPPRVHRLPPAFDPLERFRPSGHAGLVSTSPSPRSTPEFTRPEGSFAARAFGNVVHRFMERCAQAMAAGQSPDDLLAESSAWASRVEASLRGEGVSPATLGRQTGRVLEAIRSTLACPLGRWVLAPHPQASSEEGVSSAAGTLRADRIFLAGPTAGTFGGSHLWIVDFKTAEQGSRTLAQFEAVERAKYAGQMDAYARVLREMHRAEYPIRVGLFYPLLGHLMEWDTTLDPRI